MKEITEPFQRQNDLKALWLPSSIVIKDCKYQVGAKEQHTTDYLF